MNQPAHIPHQGQQVSPVEEIGQKLTQISSDLSSALPSHISVEQFHQVAMTAIQANADLMHADRQSLFNSLKKAAQDGLLPDGREGALILFKNQAQWMPMIGGVLKKLRQSGEVSSITAQVVYTADSFDFWIDDHGEHLKHRPSFDDNRGSIRLVYAMAKTRDGSVFVEVMTLGDLEKVRGASRSKNGGPWVTWWEQMAKKSAMHRLAKRLPISSDLMTVVNRDEALYDLDTRKAPEHDITPQADDKPLYGAERFNQNFPKWKAMIQAGQKTPDGVIASISSRATLSQEQQQQIKQLEEIAA